MSEDTNISALASGGIPGEATLPTQAAEAVRVSGLCAGTDSAVVTEPAPGTVAGERAGEPQNLAPQDRGPQMLSHPPEAAADAVPAPPAEPVDDVAEPTVEPTAEATEGGSGEVLTSGPPARVRAALEAVLLVVDTPVAASDLAQVLGLPRSTVEEGLGALRDEYDEQGRGFSLREVAGGWRLYTREEYAPYVERYVMDGQQTRLTQAALETLAVVAYRQPVTRSRIAAIRGVGVDGVMRTLLTRNLVEECGTDPETGGNLYRTTPLFLEKLGLRSLEELPSLAPLLPEIDAVDDVATSA